MEDEPYEDDPDDEANEPSSAPHDLVIQWSNALRQGELLLTLDSPIMN